MNDAGGYRCSCVEGFEGDHCEKGDVLAKLTINTLAMYGCLGRCITGKVA